EEERQRAGRPRRAPEADVLGVHDAHRLRQDHDLHCRHDHHLRRLRGHHRHGLLYLSIQPMSFVARDTKPECLQNVRP
ncbi:hypothetical protein PENTCL1PPCAC_4302, partial [Pristionchus entomophagus]